MDAADVSSVLQSSEPTIAYHWLIEQHPGPNLFGFPSPDS